MVLSILFRRILEARSRHLPHPTLQTFRNRVTTGYPSPSANRITRLCSLLSPLPRSSLEKGAPLLLPLSPPYRNSTTVLSPLCEDSKAFRSPNLLPPRSRMRGRKQRIPPSQKASKAHLFISLRYQPLPCPPRSTSTTRFSKVCSPC